MKKKPKKDLMPNRIKKAKKDLVSISHTFVRKRDGINGEMRGYCITCGELCEYGNFQAGHWEPDSSGGALLRYHPHNMHGQGGYCCNINRHGQQRVANAYTLRMIDLYGLEYVNHLRSFKNKTISADIIFYETMIELYKKGNEQAIVEYLESLSTPY